MPAALARKQSPGKAIRMRGGDSGGAPIKTAAVAVYQGVVQPVMRHARDFYFVYNLFLSMHFGFLLNIFPCSRYVFFCVYDIFFCIFMA